MSRVASSPPPPLPFLSGCHRSSSRRFAAVLSCCETLLSCRSSRVAKDATTSSRHVAVARELGRPCILLCCRRASSSSPARRRASISLVMAERSAPRSSLRSSSASLRSFETSSSASWRSIRSSSTSPDRSVNSARSLNSSLALGVAGPALRAAAPASPVGATEEAAREATVATAGARAAGGAGGGAGAGGLAHVLLAATGGELGGSAAGPRALAASTGCCRPLLVAGGARNSFCRSRLTVASFGTCLARSPLTELAVEPLYGELVAARSGGAALESGVLCVEDTFPFFAASARLSSAGIASLDTVLRRLNGEARPPLPLPAPAALLPCWKPARGLSGITGIGDIPCAPFTGEGPPLEDDAAAGGHTATNIRGRCAQLSGSATSAFWTPSGRSKAARGASLQGQLLYTRTRRIGTVRRSCSRWLPCGAACTVSAHAGCATS